MTKKDEKVIEEKVVDSEAKAREAIDSLREQLKEFREKSRYFSTMVLKAEGALEILLNLHPEEEPNEG